MILGRYEMGHIFVYSSIKTWQLKTNGRVLVGSSRENHRETHRETMGFSRHVTGGESPGHAMPRWTSVDVSRWENSRVPKASWSLLGCGNTCFNNPCNLSTVMDYPYVTHKIAAQLWLFFFRKILGCKQFPRVAFRVRTCLRPMHHIEEATF